MCNVCKCPQDGGRGHLMMKTLFSLTVLMLKHLFFCCCYFYYYSQRRRRTFPMMFLEPRLAGCTCRNRICPSWKRGRWRAWGRGRGRWLMKIRNLKWPKWRAEAMETDSWTSAHVLPSGPPGMWPASSPLQTHMWVFFHVTFRKSENIPTSPNYHVVETFQSVFFLSTSFKRKKY